LGGIVQCHSQIVAQQFGLLNRPVVFTEYDGTIRVSLVGHEGLSLIVENVLFTLRRIRIPTYELIIPHPVHVATDRGRLAAQIYPSGQYKCHRHL
jgi:hypothetical protein